MENNNIANYVNIFASVCDSKAKDPFNCVLFKCYKFMKGRICQMLQSWDKLLSSSTSTEIHRDCGITDDQAKSDFVQCQTKMRAFVSRICSEFKQVELNWNVVVHQNALWSLVFSTTRPWNKQISAPDASQPSSQERWQVAYLKHLWRPHIFSLPRISTKDFPYIKGKTDRSIGTNYRSVNFQWTQPRGPKSLPVVWSQRSMNFLKIQVIQGKSQPTRVAMIWLRVKVNRTRLCTAVHLARNEIKRSEESRKRTFPVQTLCMYDSLFVIYIAL